MLDLKMSTERHLFRIWETIPVSAILLVNKVVYFVKCYPDGSKIYFILSMCQRLSQKWYHCALYTRHHLMSIILYCLHIFCCVGFFEHASYSWWSALWQCISRINNMFKWNNCVENGASSVRLDLYGSTWYSEHNGNTFVTVSQLLMDQKFTSFHQ